MPRTVVNQDALDKLAAEIDVRPVAGDLTAADVVDRVVAAADGKVNGLANVAGIMDGFLPAAEVDDATWDRVFAINVTAPMRLTGHDQHRGHDEVPARRRARRPDPAGRDPGPGHRRRPRELDRLAPQRRRRQRQRRRPPQRRRLVRRLGLPGAARRRRRPRRPLGTMRSVGRPEERRWTKTDSSRSPCSCRRATRSKRASPTSSAVPSSTGTSPTGSARRSSTSSSRPPPTAPSTAGSAPARSPGAPSTSSTTPAATASSTSPTPTSSSTTSS
ncbi:SDR family NAD(P)-dependent oxidoreductase [Glycomyces sp. NEAU-S30]|uniref:SDR family NAD(P)-dependent oxidoreductase n=1 Tax=Glycomyces niveus TaxID=2820287 RepID=A0ABS3U821_9ACTN|nr:SDR family NAD(P)-dependent oxidoreductase [Glycomyces sp. NEAU-S30]